MVNIGSLEKGFNRLCKLSDYIGETSISAWTMHFAVLNGLLSFLSLRTDNLDNISIFEYVFV
jgi:hypothetical protein